MFIDDRDKVDRWLLLQEWVLRETGRYLKRIDWQAGTRNDDPF